MRLVLAAGFAGFLASACAHTVTNEQRLDGVTEAAVDSTEDAAELRCRDTSPEVQIARDRTQKKAERLARFQWAIADAKSTAARFDEAFRKDPDLVYGPEAAEWKRRQAGCTELVATLEREKARAENELEPVIAAKPVVAEKKAAPAPAPIVVAEKKSAADEAFEDDTDQLRTAYKKKAKVAKAKKAHGKKKRRVSLAAR